MSFKPWGVVRSRRREASMQDRRRDEWPPPAAPGSQHASAGRVGLGRFSDSGERRNGGPSALASTRLSHVASFRNTRERPVSLLASRHQPSRPGATGTASHRIEPEGWLDPTSRIW